MFPSSTLFALTWFSFYSYRRCLHTTNTGHKKPCYIWSLFCLWVSVLWQILYMHNMHTSFLWGTFSWPFFSFSLFLNFCITALSSKAQQFVSIPWPTSAWSSMDPLLTRRVPITSGWPTQGRSPTLDQALCVSNPHWPHTWIPQPVAEQLLSDLGLK